MKNITIKGAREHNLKNISLELPRDKFIVITGVSGSGKSTLAFDTLYAEGQRRYVESLSAYARQFLGMMSKPDVDSIDGLSPAISIEQKTTSKNPRSTVGTVTEIYDYFRLLFARVGTQHCPKCKKEIQKQTADMITDRIQSAKTNSAMILAPVVSGRKGTYEKLFEKYKKEGFSRARVNGQIRKLDEKISLKRYVKHNIEIVVDYFTSFPPEQSRLQEAIESALQLANGYVIAKFDKDEQLYSSHASCIDCGIDFDELQPRMFSFNSPFGACPECTGLGFKQTIDPSLVVPDPSRSIAEGAIAAYRNAVDGWRGKIIGGVARHYKFSVIKPWKEIPKKVQDVILYGSNKRLKFRVDFSETYYEFDDYWEGVIPQLERLYKKTESDYRKREIEKFMVENPCPACQGQRLKPTSLSVTINNKNIIETTQLSILDCRKFFEKTKFSKTQMMIAKQVLKEIKSRLNFLIDVGLGYLTLERRSYTLSGGEAQRIRLATQIGSNLMGVLYILDEPSIGLHQHNNHKLIETLQKLRDLGNTLIVVEHDEDTIRKADYVVDIGPGAGIHGGKIVALGTPKEIESNEKSLTGDYLKGKKSIAIPKKRRQPKGFLKIKGAQEHNLKKINVKIPLGTLNVITGVSGSGKSTLVNEILYKGLKKRFTGSKEKPGKHEDIEFEKGLRKVVLVDQSPIGRTPRSNPATYTKVFDEIRQLFAQTKEAKLRGYKPGRFSFNVKGGRCEYCQGDGVIKIEMNFLPDIYIDCEECKGTRYNRETLEVKYKEKSISDVLNMSVEEAHTLFENIPPIKRKLQTLKDVGLDYMAVGQSSTTLSGGEAQRIKLTRELAKKTGGDTLYILDEPTTGLHFHDVKKLLEVLKRLVDKGNTIVVIEHNLDVIKTADWIIDLGPEGGEEGGRVIAQGTPETVSQDKKSYTAKYLRQMLA